jgi:hypothetical protein
MLACPEWLLLFRAWMSPGVFLLLCLAFAVRMTTIYFLPFRDVLGMGLLFLFLPVAMTMHLRAFWKGHNRAERDRYALPPTGEPWLLKRIESPSYTFMIEFFMAMTLLLLAYTGSVIYPAGMRELPPAWHAWLRAHGGSFADHYSAYALAAFIVWEIMHMPLQSPWKPGASAAAWYQTVRPQAHGTAPLVQSKYSNSHDGTRVVPRLPIAKPYVCMPRGGPVRGEGTT